MEKFCPYQFVSGLLPSTAEHIDKGGAGLSPIERFVVNEAKRISPANPHLVMLGGGMGASGARIVEAMPEVTVDVTNFEPTIDEMIALNQQRLVGWEGREGISLTHRLNTNRPHDIRFADPLLPDPNLTAIVEKARQTGVVKFYDGVNLDAPETMSILHGAEPVVIEERFGPLHHAELYTGQIASRVRNLGNAAPPGSILITTSTGRLGFVGSENRLRVKENNPFDLYATFELLTPAQD